MYECDKYILTNIISTIGTINLTNIISTIGIINSDEYNKCNTYNKS